MILKHKHLQNETSTIEDNSADATMSKIVGKILFWVVSGLFRNEARTNWFKRKATIIVLLYYRLP